MVKADCVIVFELVGKSCLEMGVPIQPYISGMNRTPRLWSRGLVVGDFVLQAMFFVVFPDSHRWQISGSP